MPSESRENSVSALSPSATNNTTLFAGGVVGECWGSMPESTGDVKYISNMDTKRLRCTTVAAMARFQVEAIIVALLVFVHQGVS